ncbi:heparin lyase I family protein [Catenovulum maritimum]|uniref:heparin lyase I family protein n=1 Tax=Catenovulum maritimum TaxID=1513271 RepID=UPI00069E663E|nr:heparin lyase I family protein [Catenovulum maritimum]
MIHQYTKSIVKMAVMLGSLSISAFSYAQDYPVGQNQAGNGGIERLTPRIQESFEGGGWNAHNLMGTYSPGLDESLPKSFKFKQFQGPHSFSAENTIARAGGYSAKLHWKHDNPAQWNGDINIINNTDRKAMFHGPNASGNTATVWHGFSVYFPSNSTKLTGEQGALFFQLHGDPERGVGEPSRVPPIALTMHQHGFKVGYSWDSNRVSTSVFGEGTGSFEVPANMDNYKDRWVDVVIQVKTNPFTPTGFVKVWLDGKQVLSRDQIQLGYNDERGLYPSYGWYLYDSNVNRNNDMVMYLDDIRQVEHVDADYFDVAPGYFPHKSKGAVDYCPNTDLNPAAETFGFEYAVIERSELAINEPTDIAYGADGQFSYLYNQTSDITCNNSTFGGDPISGHPKHCYVRPAQTPNGPQGYTFATEAKTEFTVTGTVNIAYGANGQYKYKYNIYNNSVCGKTTVSCENSTFGGDPNQGIKKECHYQEVIPNGGPSGYLYAGDESTTLLLNKTVDIAYGANKKFKYLNNQSGQVACNNATFGGDPISGVRKSCYIKSRLFQKLN